MQTSLYYFTIVAEEMSVTRAANRLFISQQALSRHIASLEKEYNVVLFERTPRLRITAAGEKLLSYAKDVMTLEQDVVHSLASDVVAKKIKLPYGISSKKAFIITQRIFSQYKQMYPNVIPSIYEGGKEYLDVLFSQGEIEFYFKMFGHESCNGNFISLQQDDILFIVSKCLLQKVIGASWKDFLKEHKDGVTAEEIAMFPLMFPNKGSSFYKTMSHYLRHYAVDVVVEMNNYQSAIKATYEGYCGSFQSKVFCYDFLSENMKYHDDIFLLKIKDITGVSKFGIVVNSAYEKKKHVSDFIQLATEETKHLDADTNAFISEIAMRIDSL